MSTPEGWASATLSDVARWGSGGTPQAGNPSYYGGPIPWAVIGDLNDGVVLATKSSITELALANSSAKTVPAGAVLLAMYGSIGKLGIAGREMTTNQAIAFALPNERVMAKYLFFYLLSQRRNLDSAGKGAAQRNISQTVLRPWPIQFPEDLTEQRRIVDILEDHLSRLDAADRYVSSALRRLDGIAESTLRGFLTTNNDDRPLGELLEIPLSNGRSVPTRDDGFPVLRLTALKDLGVDLRERKGGDWVRADARRFLVSRGDFLIARGNGSLRLVGRGSLVRDDPDEVAYPDTAIRARAAREVITPDFLDVVWNSTRTRVQIEEMARTTAGIYKVNQKQLAAVRLPIPSMADQRRIVGRMAEIDEQARRSHHALEQARTRGAVLRPALLAAAFSGRLTGQRTDQDVIEELASV